MTDLHAPRPCEMCGKTFQPRSKGQQAPQVFCGTSCRNNHQKVVYEAGKRAVEAMPVLVRSAWAEALKD